MHIRKKSVVVQEAFFVEDYQEDRYEKFQVNSSNGFAGKAFQSLHPRL